MKCIYFDHTMCSDSLVLAELSKKHRNNNYLPVQLGISVITCHRIEYYFNRRKDLENFIQELQGFKEITKTKEAIDRLLYIAIGLKSEILGENAIFKQVSQSINKYLYYHENCKEFVTLIRLAKLIRDKHDFYSPNHGQIVLKEMLKAPSDQLVLIGSGMLNRSVLQLLEKENPYKKIYLISRFSDRIKSYVKRVQNCTILSSEIEGFIKPNIKYDLFSAIDTYDYGYISRIINLSNAVNCITLADLSAVPIITSHAKKNYYTLYSDNTKKIVKEYNFGVRNVQSKVINSIKEFYG